MRSPIRFGGRIFIGAFLIGLGGSNSAEAADEFSSTVALKFFLYSGGSPVFKDFTFETTAGVPTVGSKDLLTSTPHTVTSGAASGNAQAGKLGVSISGFGNADLAGTGADMSVEAISTLKDFLTIAPTARHPAGTVIHLANNMNLSGSSADTFQAQLSTQSRPDRDFVDAQSEVILRATGTGIDAGQGAQSASARS